jgi:hypothetical protein
MPFHKAARIGHCKKSFLQLAGGACVPLPIYNFSSIRVEELTCDIGAILRSKEEVTWRNFCGMSSTRHGDIAAEIRNFFRFKCRSN